MRLKKTTSILIIYFLINLLVTIYFNLNNFKPMFRQGIASILLYVFVKYWGNLLIHVENKINLLNTTLSASFIFKFILNSLFLLSAYNLMFFNVPYRLELVNKLVFLLLTFLSSILLHIGLIFSYRGYGNRVFNCYIALCTSILSTNFAYNLLALLSGNILILIVCVLGILYLYFFLKILYSDLLSFFYPSSGIGIFFGTFNPIHKTHIKIIKDAIKRRNLEKILIHPTVIPKLHSDALSKKEIYISKQQNGMRTYSKTKYADNNINYFPTGDSFYEYKIRKYLIKKALYEEGLIKCVTVLDLPNIYQDKGFLGIIDFIKQKYPNKHLHGIHGTDTGGIWVRYLFIKAGGIFPFPILRKDNVSASRIRSGSNNLTTIGVQKIIDELNQGISFKKIMQNEHHSKINPNSGLKSHSKQNNF